MVVPQNSGHFSVIDNYFPKKGLATKVITDGTLLRTIAPDHSRRCTTILGNLTKIHMQTRIFQRSLLYAERCVTKCYFLENVSTSKGL
jgi:hypothetical protein